MLVHLALCGAEPPCATWATNGVQPGTTDTASVSTIWNGRVVVAGTFLSAGGISASGIAAWDGAEWSPFTPTLTGIRALTVYQGKLIAAGTFLKSGLNRIAAWDGAAWQPMGSGFDGLVSSLAVYNGDLVASGLFGMSGTTPVNRIARWDGTSWQAVGGGLSDAANSLVQFGDDLIAGGNFLSATNDGLPVTATRIARWNGTAWSAMSEGFDKAPTSLQVVHGVLYAGGQFLASGARTLKYLAQWDGNAWQPVGAGPNNSVYAMTSFRGRLYIGGQFTQVGSLPADSFAWWDGQAWHATSDNFNDWIMTLSATDDRLFAGGFFTFINGLRVNRVASWDETAWDCLGSGFLTATSVFGFGDRLLVSGERPYEGVTADSLYAWDGRDWARLGPAAGTPRGVLAYAVLGNDLVVGGQFSVAGMQNVARWNGLAWSKLGTIDNGRVTALAVYNGDLYAGGDFSLGGNRYSFGRWTGTTWQPLGISRVVSINSMCVHNGLLYMGGSFGSLAGFPSQNIAAWNGSSLVSVGNGLPTGWVNAISVFEGDLVVGGLFTSAGATSASKIARWNGTEWSVIGSGVSSNVKTIAEHGNRLFAGLEDGRLCAWDGTVWTTVATVLPPFAGLFSQNGELAVLGAFTQVAGRPSSKLARYADSGTLPIHTQPQPVAPECGENAVFRFLPFSGYAGLNYQWFKDGAPLEEGAIFKGTTTDTLIVSKVSNSEEGAYRCVISSECSATLSESAPLTLPHPCCPSDLNGDNMTDDADFSVFVIAYNILDCADAAMPASCPADINGDEFVDDGDFVFFVQAYNELLCP